MIFTEKVHRVYYEMYWASSSYPGHTCSKHPLPIDSVCHFALFSVGHCFVYTSIYCFWFGIFKLFLYQAASSQWFSSLELNDFLASRKREQERKARGNNMLASWKTGMDFFERRYNEFRCKNVDRSLSIIGIGKFQ